MSAAERASKVSSAEQANECVVQANKQTDEQVAQYLCLDSWLFWTIVTRTFLVRSLTAMEQNQRFLSLIVFLILVVMSLCYVRTH